MVYLFNLTIFMAGFAVGVMGSLGVVLGAAYVSYKVFFRAMSR